MIDDKYSKESRTQPSTLPMQSPMSLGLFEMHGLCASMRVWGYIWQVMGGNLRGKHIRGVLRDVQYGDGDGDRNVCFLYLSLYTGYDV